MFSWKITTTCRIGVLALGVGRGASVAVRRRGASAGADGHGGGGDRGYREQRTKCAHAHTAASRGLDCVKVGPRPHWA
jgi:hypothetical protein